VSFPSAVISDIMSTWGFLGDSATKIPSSEKLCFYS
jgi:hypothetical protein